MKVLFLLQIKTMEFLSQWSYFIATIIILNIVAHIFLVRFFKWYDKESKLNSPWFLWLLLVPPFALLLTSFLVGIGLLLKDKDKK
jgi:hypothetical protein